MRQERAGEQLRVGKLIRRAAEEARLFVSPHALPLWFPRVLWWPRFSIMAVIGDKLPARQRKARVGNTTVREPQRSSSARLKLCCWGGIFIRTLPGS
jgi:hypothetical protein